MKNTLNWSQRIIIWLIVVVFLLYLQPLDHFPSVTFSFVWGLIVVTKSFDFLYGFSKTNETIFHSLLIGILIGSCITAFQPSPIDVALVRDVFFALSPLFLFRKVLSVKERCVETIRTQ
ncbi:hypothetical protein [Alkalihalobacillus sp. TS-13]|uniref:hypothetical protein n=1 Tax=Alkalihalobacillus sp. TS-13 TaxID=2842455 RepID=UPI001C86A285|nr:hypothetical protein [Alkalihalobacillus sp. TS-13]